MVAANVSSPIPLPASLQRCVGPFPANVRLQNGICDFRREILSGFHPMHVCEDLCRLSRSDAFDAPQGIRDTAPSMQVCEDHAETCAGGARSAGTGLAC